MQTTRHIIFLPLIFVLLATGETAHGVVRENMLRILQHFRDQNSTMPIFYGVSEENQTLESFCQKLEDVLFTSTSSKQLLTQWHSHHQTTNAFLNQIQGASPDTNQEAQLLVGEQPLSDAAILLLLWYAATFQRPIIVLDMFAAPEYRPSLYGFYLTADGRVQGELNDQWLSQQVSFVNGAVILVRTGSVWSYIFRQGFQANTYSVLYHIKRNLSLFQTIIRPVSAFNLNPTLGSQQGILQPQGRITFSIPPSLPAKINPQFLMTVRGKQLTTALFARQAVRQQHTQPVTAALLPYNTIEKPTVQLQTVPFHQQFSSLSLQSTAHVNKTSQLALNASSHPLTNRTKDVSHKTPSSAPAIDRSTKPAHLITSEQKEYTPTSRPTAISVREQTTLSEPETCTDQRDTTCAHQQFLKQMVDNMVARRASMQEENRTYLAHIKDDLTSREAQTIAHLQRTNPRLLALMKSVQNTICDPDNAFDQQHLMSQVRDMYVQYFEHLQKDKELVTSAGLLTTLEEWIKSLAKHPLIILHRSNNILWADIIRTLTELETAREQYRRSQKAKQSLNKQQIAAPEAESFLQELKNLLEDTQYHTQETLFLDALQPYQKLIQAALILLREQSRFIPPGHYPPMFKALHDLLNRHKDRILAAERPYYPTWQLAGKFMHVMMDNGIEGQQLQTNYSDIYWDHIDKAKKNFSSLFVQEQMLIAEEFTGHGFFGNVLQRLIHTGRMKSLSGYQLSSSGAITGAKKPQALMNTASTLSAAEQWNIVETAGYKDLVSLKHFTPDLTSVDFFVSQEGDNKTVMLQSGTNCWALTSSQFMSSCLDIHESSPITFADSSPGFRRLYQTDNQQHMKDQLQKNTRGQGYLHTIQGGKEAYRRCLALPKKAQVQALPAPKDKMTLPWNQCPWEKAVTCDQSNALFLKLPYKQAIQ